ncbi:DUF2779 domain-containing protein [bacterium]|nr:DUF2779 domain-containing protein [bacterium]
MNRIITLTKSRFKLACECPTKLFYTGKKEYANQSLSDPFLAELAKGGYQVGELAKLYHPGGVDIKSLDYDESLAQTNVALQQENATIYEAAVAYENLFIRIDVLEKRGNHLHLIEVKAKSFDPDDRDAFLTRKGTIKGSWRPYLYDVAFQKHVLTHAFPGMVVSSYLMMADKSAECPTDGLNQKLRITRNAQNRLEVIVSPEMNDADLFVPILAKVNVDPYVDLIWENHDSDPANLLGFEDRIALYAASYADDRKILPVLSSTCASCEFRCSEEDFVAGKRDGYRECFSEVLGWDEADFADPTVLTLWNFRRKDELIEDRRIKMTDVTEDDIKPSPDGKPGLSTSERQWMQVDKIHRGDDSPWIDTDSLRREMHSWRFPLHFIDFETTMVAIPFNAGRRPYEEIAFQFSHHVVHEDGRVEHAGQYLNAKPGVFPNYDFVRALKRELEQDDGSIFRYAAHENTYLCKIHQQLRADPGVPDRDELCAFIQTITRSTGSSVETWEGERNMIDMLELVKRYYYDPYTGGSNSIKYVLPAILQRSEFLQHKYSEPIYGAAGGIPSKNYQDWRWIVRDNDTVRDPYKLLPRLFQDIDPTDEELLSESDELKDGAAAMTAYARMQFEEMGDAEHRHLHDALLRYCELDTMAMVMIYEGWRNLLVP